MALALTELSDHALRAVIRDAELELAKRKRERQGVEGPEHRGQRAFVQDLAHRPVCGFDLETLKSLYALDFTSSMSVSGLVYGAYSEAHSEKGSSKPLKTLTSSLRVRTLLSIEGLHVPWQMKDTEFPAFRQFLADVRGVPVSSIDAEYLSKLSGRMVSMTVRWLKKPDRYRVTGATARWFAFVRWTLESFAPSERPAVLEKIIGLVALELSVRAKAGVGEDVADGDETGKDVQEKAPAKGRRGRGAKVS